MKGNTKAMALSMAAIFALSIIAIGVMAKPPQQPPAYVEPTGNLVMTSGMQPVLGMGTGYARVYDWVNGQFNNTWSGKTDMGNSRVAIGDVDNDGEKEVVTAGSSSTVTRVKGKNVVTTTYGMKIWQDGDASDSPSFSYDPGFVPSFMEIGDADNDGSNELVMSGGGYVWVWGWNGSGFTEEAKVSGIGKGGLTIADADNDGKNEILVGMGDADSGRKCHGVVVKHSNGAYSVVGDLGPAGTSCCIDELSVGDLDGTAGNEIFGSGYCNGNIYVWKYANNAYGQVWTTQETSTEFHQNNEIADINGDGKNEIAFTELSGYNLIVYKYAGNNVWSELGTYGNCYNNLQDAMFSGDFDGDSKSELLVQGSVWDWDGSVMKDIQDLANPQSISMA